MKVLVTGATGFVGSAVIRRLRKEGHQVLALSRSERSTARLLSQGIGLVRGSLEDIDLLRQAASEADAVVHTAYDHSSLLRMRRAADVERQALWALSMGLAATGGTLVAAGGFAPVRAEGTVITERDQASSRRGLMGRNVEKTVMGLASQGVRAAVVRLPLVHGDEDRFTLPRYIEIARHRGVSAYIGNGRNLLPAVHVDDAATVFVRAAERARPGARYDAVAEQGIPFREIAEVIGRRLEVPVRSLNSWQALRHFGVYAGYAGRDAPASGEATRARLDWEPTGPGLLEDLDRPEYFAG